MNTVLRAGAVALALAASPALAQTDPAVPPPTPLQPPPDGTLATVHTTKAVDANGNQVEQTQSTYRDSKGVAQDTQTTRTTVAPPPPVVTSTTSTTTTSTTTPP